MNICCLDLEGVLVPEIWIHVAKAYRLESLKLTTRDIPDYDKLMNYRIRILKKEKIRLRDIQRVIQKMHPLPGAVSFLNQLRVRFPVIILSDTFYEFALPLIQKLGGPVLFCNQLKTDRLGYIRGYDLRQKDGKRKAVRALRSIGFHVKVSGDSFNDLTMLKEADEGILFKPPPAILKSHGHFPIAWNYKTLLKFFFEG